MSQTTNTNLLKRQSSFFHSPQHFVSPKKNYLLLCFILLAAFGLRLIYIHQPFTDIYEWRQSSTAMMAENFYKKSWNIFYPQVNWVGPGPGYQGREFQTISYLAALCYTVLGQHDWIGRFLASLFGVWGVFALYNLVRLVWNEGHALASAAMMALLPLSILVERSFLPDPVMVSLVTTSLWMLVAYLQTEQRKYLIIACLSGCLGFLTKIPGLIIGLPMLYAVISFAEKKQQRLFSILLLITSGAITLVPVTIYYLWARHLSITYPPHHFAGSDGWVWDNGFQAWLIQKYFLKHAYDIFLKLAWGLPFIALAIFACFRPIRSLKAIDNQQKGIFLFHFWLAAFSVYYLIGAKELVDNPWNFHLLSPVIAAFSGRGLVLISERVWKPMFRFWLFVFFACFILISDYKVLKPQYVYKYAAADYKMGLALRHIKREGELVVCVGTDIGSPMAIYYSQCNGWIFPPFYRKYEYALFQEDQKNIDAINELRGKGADWFGIVSEHYHDIEVNHPKFNDFLKKNYRVAQQTADFTIFQLTSSPYSAN